MTKEENFILKNIKAKVNQKDPLAEVILFGSRARNQATKNSDWDILILLHQSSFEKEIRDELFDIELESGMPISTLIFPKIIWENKHSGTPFYFNVKNNGILL